MIKKLIPTAIRRSLRAALNRQKERRRLRRGYNELAIDDAAEICSLEGARVLVVGANTGEDCARFLGRGAAEAHGLDIDPDLGRNFSHPKVFYHRQSIEAADLPSDQFDLVYAVATMEHVADIAAGFSEMVRLAKPGGTIFSSAAPLWESPYGHHMSCFDGHPWVHLVFNTPQIVAYAKSNGIEGERGHPISAIAEYIHDNRNFNMIPGDQYVGACSRIPGIVIVTNRLDLEDANLLAHPLGQLALSKGFRPESLLATRHLFVAKKQPA